MLDDKNYLTDSVKSSLLTDVSKSLLKKTWMRVCFFLGSAFIIAGIIGFAVFPTVLRVFIQKRFDLGGLVLSVRPVIMAITANKAKIGVIVLGFLGVLLLVVGIVALSLFPTIMKAKIQENMVLEEGKENYEKWKKTPIPVTFKVFLFNVTNPEDVVKGGYPHVEDIGPYTFQQFRSKDVLSFNKTAMTVTYDDKKRYFFVPEESKSMDNKIYNINLPLQGILMFLKKVPDFYRNLIVPGFEGILQNYNESLFYHRTARELLFQGYKVDLIQDLIDLASAFVTVPQILPNNTFGFLYGKNNSGDGIFEVFTGHDDIGKYSQIVKWKNMSRIPFWNNQYCNMMNGTDGSQFPPPVTRRDVLYVYTPELCRSVSLEYEKDVKVKGIPALRFVTPEKLFASPLVNPDNMCYCTEPQYCELSGILDVSPCREGLKLAVTGPHFFQGHKYIKERVSGLNPSREAHETYVDIEPNTGLVLRASRKLQMNFILTPFKEMDEMKDLPMTVVPLIWVIEEAELTDEVAALFTAKVRTPVTIAKSVLTACIVLGILWIVIAGFVTIYILVKEQKTAKAVIKSKYKVVPQKAEDILKSEKPHNVNA